MTPDAALAMPWPDEALTAREDAPPCPGETERQTRAIAAGDTAAFAGFYEAWFDRAYALARSLTRRDESFCLDVVQDAMLRVVRSIPRLEDPRALERWMVRVVHSTALDRLKREHRIARREERAARKRAEVQVAEAALARLEVEERMAWVEARLAEATVEEKALLAGRFESGKTFHDLGASLGMTGNAASGRLGRFLTKLRARAREAFRDR